MRLLACLDGTNAEQIGNTVKLFFAGQSPTIGLLTVIDTGPRNEMSLTRERLMMHTMRHEPWTDEMLKAEAASAHEILSEAAQWVETSDPIVRQGRPELEIVNAAAEWKADVILIGARTEYGEPLRIGPKSVGHVARFVLDHAPCPVLLIRPNTRDQFPIHH